MSEEIRTDRLLLRRFRLDDAQAMHKMLSDPEAMRYWSTPPHQTIAETQAWVQSELEVDDGDDFVVTLDGHAIGKLGCWRLPEVGFLFDRSRWGRGYASEAMAAFIARRRGLGSRELVADTDPNNVASICLLQRHGFVESGRASRTFNIGGVWKDSIFWRLAL